MQQRALADVQAQATYERQQAMLKKELAFIERFKARASHAAQVQSRVKKLEKIEKVTAAPPQHAVQFDFKPPPRSGEDVAKLAGVNKTYGDLVGLPKLRLPHPPSRALVRAGHQRRRKIDAAQADRRLRPARRRPGLRRARASRWATSPSTRWTSSMAPRRSGRRSAMPSPARAGRATHAGRLLRLFWR